MQKWLNAVRVTLLLAAVVALAAVAYLSGSGDKTSTVPLRAVGIACFVTGVATRWVRRPIQLVALLTIFIGAINAQYSAYYFGYAAASNSEAAASYGYVAGGFTVLLAAFSVYWLRKGPAPAA